jgi:chromosome segregation ATPase
LKDSEERIAMISSEVKSLENDIDKLTKRRHEIEQSDEYRNYAVLESKARELENEKAGFREYVSDLFSHLNRAFTKYSYGVSKSVSRKIDTLSNSPWEIFLDNQEYVRSNADMADSKGDIETIEAYRTLLVEIRGAVSKGVISLKDSDKVLTYLDRAIDLFPKLKSRGKEIEENAFAIRKNQNPEFFDSIQALDEKIRRNKEDLDEKKSLEEELRTGLNERKSEIHILTDECNNLLTDVIGQEKTISSI